MIWLAQFSGGEALTAAAAKALKAGLNPVDAFTPIPLPALNETLAASEGHIRPAMAVGGFGAAIIVYATEYYSAVINYPINSGGRPLHSWPAFVLVPFAIGILAAAICGLIAFLYDAGLPCLHHALFALNGFERASQDGFVLALVPPDDRQRDVKSWLRNAGATRVWEIAP